MQVENIVCEFKFSGRWYVADIISRLHSKSEITLPQNDDKPYGGSPIKGSSICDPRSSSNREKVEDEEKEVNVNPFQNLELYLSSHFSFLFYIIECGCGIKWLRLPLLFLIFYRSFQSIVSLMTGLLRLRIFFSRQLWNLHTAYFFFCTLFLPLNL